MSETYATPGVAERVAAPIDVNVKNWADPVKPPYVKRTTFKTYTIDPNGVDGPKNVQICDYEPTRIRLAIFVVDAACALTLNTPTLSPDTNTLALPPVGLYLQSSPARVVEFYGPDAMWLNSLGAETRVSVLKEYC